MSNRLDSVKTFDQFGHDHWKALGTKLGGVEVVKAILRDTAVVTVEPVRRLTVLTPSVVEASEVNLKEFFANRVGLWTSDNFNTIILDGVSEGNVSATGTIFGYGDLKADKDAEIGRELPKDHVFEKVDTFLVHLATLIRGQWDGKEGVLLNNGHCNIFYVKKKGAVYSVNVLWGDGERSWFCYADLFVFRGWDAGNRAFSATAA